MSKQRTTTTKPKKRRVEALVEALLKFEPEINKNKAMRLEIDLFPDKIQVKKTDFVTVNF